MALFAYWIAKASRADVSCMCVCGYVTCFFFLFVLPIGRIYSSLSVWYVCPLTNHGAIPCRSIKPCFPLCFPWLSRSVSVVQFSSHGSKFKQLWHTRKSGEVHCSEAGQRETSGEREGETESRDDCTRPRPEKKQAYSRLYSVWV